MTEEESEKNPPVLFICKPESGSQGHGIFISENVEDMRLSLNKQNEQNREKFDN